MVTFEEVKPFLNIGNGANPNVTLSPDDYPMIQTLLIEVPAAMESYCGRKLTENDLFNVTEWLWDDEDFVNIGYLPINKVSEIKVDGVVYTGDYDIEQYGIRLNDLEPNRTKKIKVQVKGFGGFDEMPPELKMCARKQIVYENQRKDFLGAKAISEGGTNVSYEPEVQFLKSVKQVLKKYKHPRALKL